MLLGMRLGPYLNSLNLDGSVLPAQLPASWGQNFKKVDWMSISGSQLVSTIPTEWGIDGAFPLVGIKVARAEAVLRPVFAGRRYLWHAGQLLLLTIAAHGLPWPICNIDLQTEIPGMRFPIPMICAVVLSPCADEGLEAHKAGRGFAAA